MTLKKTEKIKNDSFSIKIAMWALEIWLKLFALKECLSKLITIFSSF